MWKNYTDSHYFAKIVLGWRTGFVTKGLKSINIRVPARILSSVFVTTLPLSTSQRMSFTLRTQAPKASSRALASSRAIPSSPTSPSAQRSFFTSATMENPTSAPPPPPRMSSMTALMYRGPAHTSSPQPFQLFDEGFAGADSSVYRIAPVVTYSGPAYSKPTVSRT